MPAPGEAVLRIGAELAGLSRLYPWLEAEIGLLPQAIRHAMHVALEEAVTNVALHAFPTGEGGAITIQLHLSAGVAVLVVEDAGRPFDQASAPAAKPSASSDVPGGHGLALLRHYCRDASYQRIGDENRLTLRFSYPP